MTTFRRPCYPDSSMIIISSSLVARYGLAVVLWIWVFYVLGGGMVTLSKRDNHDNTQLIVDQKLDTSSDNVPSMSLDEPQPGNNQQPEPTTTTTTTTITTKDYDSYDKPICLDTLTPAACPAAFMTDEWMTPKAIIAGTQKGGTRALLHYLGDHPDAFTSQGTEAKILNNPGNMYDHDNNNANYYNDTMVDPCHVRQVYHNLFVAKQGGLYDPSIPASQQPFLFDKSPSYMLHSEIVPQRLTCVFSTADAVKIIILLRNPTDRAFSHYHHNDDKYGPPQKSFRSMVEKEITLLRQLGIDHVGTTTSSVQAQANFWKRYKATAKNKESLIARGLYVMQLRQWFGVLQHAYNNTTDLSDTILLLESERLHTHTQETLDDVLDFLQMAPYTYPNTADHHAHSYPPMDIDTRQLLDDFFQPWNEQLRDFLAPYGVSLSWAS